MDVKSAFINGYIMEEVYAEQPPRFENFDFPIMSISWKMLFMLKDLVYFLLSMILKLVNSTLPFFLLKLKKMICY